MGYDSTVEEFGLYGCFGEDINETDDPKEESENLNFDSTEEMLIYA